MRLCHTGLTLNTSYVSIHYYANICTNIINSKITVSVYYAFTSKSLQGF